MKIREADIDIIYVEIMDKIDSPVLDYPSFKTVTTENPEILDFFDIFNNKILENMTLVIHRQILRRLNGLSNSIDHLIEQISSIKKNKKGFTITLKSFIERSIKKESLFKEGVIITKSNEKQGINNNYFLGNHTNNANSPSNNNNPNINNNNNNNNSNKKQNNSDVNVVNINEKNKNAKLNRINTQSNSEALNKQDNKICEIPGINKNLSTNFYDDKLILSFDIENSISRKKDDSIGTNKMFSVSKKLNVPFFPDNEEEEEIDLSEEEESEEDNSFVATEKSGKNYKIITNKKEIYNNRSNSASILKEEITKSNTYINDSSNNEGVKYDKKYLNEIYSLNKNLVNGQQPNILVNNINNIHNVNIINNEILNIQNFNNLGNLSLLNKKTSLKLNAGLPPTYNFTKKSTLRGRDKEDSINGNFF